MKEIQEHSVYKLWYNVYKHWEDAQIAEFILALNKYVFEGKETTCRSECAQTLFVFAKYQIDENNEKYFKKCAKNRENIQKRWSARNSKKVNNIDD